MTRWEEYNEKLNHLLAGNYRYVIIAEDSSGKEKTLISKSFKVEK